MRRSDGTEGERGAAVVEFALVLPLLLFVVMGIIEFGWAFNQNLDIRHGARETARLVDVNYKVSAGSSGTTQTAQIVEAGCDRMDGDTAVVVTLRRSGDKPGAVSEVVVERPMQSITGMFDFVVGDRMIRSAVKTRLEQQATWNPTATAVPCT